jgi:hypothetical protein
VAELHAWVDESGSDQAVDPNTYILAAALCPHDALDSIRSLMESLRVPGTRKLHWRDETKPQRRMKITQAIADSDAVEHLVVIRAGLPTDSHKRPRQIALRRLLLELDRREVMPCAVQSQRSAPVRAPTCSCCVSE